MTKYKAKTVLETREDAVIKAMIKTCWTLEEVQAYVSAANQIDEDREWVYTMLEKQAKKSKKAIWRDTLISPVVLLWVGVYIHVWKA